LDKIILDSEWAETFIGSYRPTSIKFLKANAFLEEDVFDFEGNRLLVRGKTFISQEALHKIKAANKGRDTIYVSSNMYLKFLKETKEEKRLSREEETGYGSVKHDTVEMLTEITEKKEVNTKSLLRVSVEVSGKLEKTDSKTIFSLINALAPKDEYLQRHCVNTGLLNGLFGRWLGLSKDKIDRLVLIGLLHDAGKAMTPLSILTAPRDLTKTEFEIMKMHSVKSYDILNAFPESVRLAARAHHEKFDGSGYPDGLSGEEIPIEARITAISDVYDALVSQRTYKSANSPFRILSIIKDGKGKHFDPELVDIFMKNMPNELIDKDVLLSDGSVGKISSIDRGNPEYPIIDIDGQKVRTNKNLHCVSMI